MAFPDGWTKRLTIAASPTVVGTGGVTDFTSLVSAASLYPLLAALREDGGDLVCTLNADGTGRLAIDVLPGWSSSSGTGFVRVGPLSLSSVSTNTLYFWGGNPSATQPAAGDVSGNLPADVKAYTVQPTVTGATLHADYDAAKTAASQASVNTIDGLVDTLVARIVGTLAAGTHQPQSGDAYARIGAPAGASLIADLGTATAATQAQVLAVKAKTDALPGDPASDTTVNTRLAAAAYTAPDNAGIAAAGTAAGTAQAAAEATQAAVEAIKGAGWSNETLKAIHAALAGVGGVAGPGGTACTVHLETADAVPIADVDVWISTDAAGDNVIAGPLQTGADGDTKIPFMLDPGNYYAWRQKSGVNFDNPQELTVS
jgi:hypothetical protein